MDILPLLNILEIYSQEPEELKERLIIYFVSKVIIPGEVLRGWYKARLERQDNHLNILEVYYKRNPDCNRLCNPLEKTVFIKYILNN